MKSFKSILKQTVLGTILFMSSFGAFAQDPAAQASFNGVVVTLTAEECFSPKVLAMLPPLDTLPFKVGAGTVSYQGQLLQLCWRIDNGQVLVLDETGDGGQIDPSMFTSIPAI